MSILHLLIRLMFYCCTIYTNLLKTDPLQLGVTKVHDVWAGLITLAQRGKSECVRFDFNHGVSQERGDSPHSGTGSKPREEVKVYRETRN